MQFSLYMEIISRVVFFCAGDAERNPDREPVRQRQAKPRWRRRGAAHEHSLKPSGKATRSALQARLSQLGLDTHFNHTDHPSSFNPAPLRALLPSLPTAASALNWPLRLFATPKLRHHRRRPALRTRRGSRTSPPTDHALQPVQSVLRQRTGTKRTRVSYVPRAGRGARCKWRTRPRRGAELEAARGRSTDRVGERLEVGALNLGPFELVSTCHHSTRWDHLQIHLYKSRPPRSFELASRLVVPKLLISTLGQLSLGITSSAQPSAISPLHSAQRPT